MTVQPRNRFGCGLGSSDETVMFEVSQNSNLILIFAKYTVHTDLGVLGQGLRRTLARSGDHLNQALEESGVAIDCLVANRESDVASFPKRSLIKCYDA